MFLSSWKSKGSSFNPCGFLFSLDFRNIVAHNMFVQLIFVCLLTPLLVISCNG